jgi:sarcosine oxidase subunit gamma
MLEHHTPFDSLREDLGQHGLAIELVGLHVSPVRNRGLILLQTASVAALQDALDQALDLTLPPTQNATVRGDHALLWLTPMEWLLELQVANTCAVATDLSRRLPSSVAVVTDISDALVSFELRGARAPEILMTGCSLDLRPHAFPAGRVARTALADVPAILWNPGKPDRLRCFIDRGFTQHFLIWLEGAI